MQSQCLEIMQSVNVVVDVKETEKGYFVTMEFDE